MVAVPLRGSDRFLERNCDEEREIDKDKDRDT